MTNIMIILLIIIGISLFLIWYVAIYNRFQTYIIRINEAEANIDSVLRKRFDLLNKSIGIIKSVTKDDTEVLTIITKLKSRKLSNFELDRQLYEAINEYTSYKEEYKELLKSENFMKIDLSLNESEAEIVALRKYYNDIITDYNEIARTFPANIVRKISKYPIRPYFDGKNMEDNDIEDFKL